MHIRCKQNAYSMVTGRRMFTKGKDYPVISNKEDGRFLLARSDEGEWVPVSMRIDSEDFTENEVFNTHFDYVIEDFQAIN